MTTTYISCASNRNSQTFDWAKNGLVCYGYGHGVAVYDPDYETTGKIIKTLDKHECNVIIVQWIKKENNLPEDELLSASLDGTINIWKKSGLSFTPDLTLTLDAQLTVAYAAYLYQNPSEDSSLLIAASSCMEVFTIWHRNSAGDLDKQELDFRGYLPFDLIISHLPGASKSPLIIVATEDGLIRLYAWNMDEKPGRLNFQACSILTGHQDWVLSLDLVSLNSETSMLASGSRDVTVRLWKFSVCEEDKPEEDRVNAFKVGNENFEVTLESILTGHEHWIYGVHWHPAVKVNGEWKRPNKLLTSGFDSTMLIWEPNAAGVWTEIVRLGRYNQNVIGFYSGRFNGDGTSVIAHGSQGTIYMWKLVEDRWLPRSAPSGHYEGVTDMQWESRGRYLISTSLDKSTRVHVPFKTTEKSAVWHEIARPQIHGYNINCLAILNSGMLASGSDEKAVRIFRAPDEFMSCLETEEWKNPRCLAGRAGIPALGLTNRIIECYDDPEEDTEEGAEERPPTEEEVCRYGIWAEAEKLYGHGYEIFAMAARHDGKILASSCKSSSAEHSSIILWSTTTWGQVQKLSGHRLTVTQMEFSPDDQYLVSVSRDRRWGLYKLIDDNNSIQYETVLMSPSDNALHVRIIWCCCWSPDSKFFATGSRDGKIGIWSIDSLVEGGNQQPITSLDLAGESVTALAFARKVFKNNVYILAIGLDKGNIQLKKMIVDNDNIKFVDCLEFDKAMAHHKTVRRLSFRPEVRDLQLASCSNDMTVKIFDFDLEKLLEKE